MVTPIGRLRLAIRAARRRRYGYAALRVLRAGLRAAVAIEIRRSVDVERPYVSQRDELRALYSRALAAHLKRFGRLHFDDERSAP